MWKSEAKIESGWADERRTFYYRGPDESGDSMQPHAVKVPVVASVPLDCEFWSEDDGWTGCCTQLAIRVHGNNFEDAKKTMEIELQAKIEAVLRSGTGDNVAA